MIPFCWGGSGATAMMGEQCDGQASLFYEFCLEDRVPADHLLRKIDRFLDLKALRRDLAPFYSPIGRPSIDPELMIGMLIVGYCVAIRSERRLCEEVDLNLAYRWFCRLGLEGRVPDHSTFSKTRHGRFRDSDTFRHLFELVVRRAIAEGLVGGEGFAVDASLIAADANKQRSLASTDEVDWPELATTRRSVREYLDTLDDAAWGAASEVVPKFISASDPAAQWTGAHKGHAFFAYSDNYLIDLKAAIIVDVEATRASRRAPVDEPQSTSPSRRAPVDEPQSTSRGRRCQDNDRPYRGLLRLETAAALRRQRLRIGHRRPYAMPRTGVTKDNTRLYRARQSGCAACVLKARCCPGQPHRKVPRSVHEAARDVARGLAGTPEYLQSRRERKKVEMLFAHLKRILRLNRLRLRGPLGAKDEFLLAAIA